MGEIDERRYISLGLALLRVVASRAEKEITDFFEVAISAYPNRRVVHLAKYGRSERVRKKNRNRILKWIRGRLKA